MDKTGADRWRVLFILAIFAVAMGWLEAVVVEYIRRIIGLEPGVDYSQYLLNRGVNSVDSFAAFLADSRLLWVERTREAATIVMLVCVSLLSFRAWRLRLGAFLWTFAIWDLSYYVGLYIRLDWPKSLLDIDCLFLIPRPWFAPVWVPVVVMAGFILAAAMLLQRSQTDG